MPEDIVYDTTSEMFTLSLDDLKAGEHVVSLKATDAVGNVTYKTVELHVMNN